MNQQIEVDIKPIKENSSEENLDFLISDDQWDYYSGLPNPSWYEDEEDDNENV